MTYTIIAERGDTKLALIGPSPVTTLNRIPLFEIQIDGDESFMNLTKDEAKMLVDVLLPWIDEGNSGKLRGPIKRHALKTDKGYFDRVWAGQKNFELRKNDRAFQVGDTLLLREYDPENSSYSGREILAGVDFIFSSLPGLQDGYCIMKIFIEKQYKVTPVEIEGRLTN